MSNSQESDFPPRQRYSDNYKGNRFYGECNSRTQLSKNVWCNLASLVSVEGFDNRHLQGRRDLAIKDWGTPQQHTKRPTLEEFHDESSNSSALTQVEFRGEILRSTKES